MKAVVIRRYGGPEVLEYGEFPDPVVGKLCRKVGDEGVI
jgi:NADPH:quinone reductase-like Zn-dependent oxidoreductase